MAKFCPKCGLPLKEDTTLMGANQGSYVVDDSGPSPWVIIGGALGVVVVALSIGWMTGQGQHKADTVVRQPINPTPMRTGGFFNNGLATAPSYGWGSTGPTSSAVNYNPSVRWVYTPPRQSSPPSLPRVLPPVGPRPEDMPPPNMGVMQAMINPPRRPPVVTAVLPIEPVAPPVAVMAYAPAAFVSPGGRDMVIDGSTGPLTSVQAPGQDVLPEAAGREDPRSDWVYDPVQERWALRGERAAVQQSPYRVRVVRPQVPRSR